MSRLFFLEQPERSSAQNPPIVSHLTQNKSHCFQKSARPHMGRCPILSNRISSSIICLYSLCFTTTTCMLFPECYQVASEILHFLRLECLPPQICKPICFPFPCFNKIKPHRVFFLTTHLKIASLHNISHISFILYVSGYFFLQNTYTHLIFSYLLLLNAPFLLECYISQGFLTI